MLCFEEEEILGKRGDMKTFVIKCQRKWNQSKVAILGILASIADKLGESLDSSFTRLTITLKQTPRSRVLFLSYLEKNRGNG